MNVNDSENTGSVAEPTPAEIVRELSRNASDRRFGEGISEIRCEAGDRSAPRREADPGPLREGGERPQALEEPRATLSQVIKTERMRALGQMASGIAHDFNNALTQILGFTELLLMDHGEAGTRQRAKRYLELIHTAAEDAAEIVRRMREFYRSRSRGETFGPLVLEPLVTEVIALTRPKWKEQAETRGVTVGIEAHLDRCTTVIGNDAELRELLTNLILNAVDAMPRGGTITLRTESDGDRTLLTVSDTGTGMTEEVRQNCLEPFFTTKGRVGSGLGLAAVHGILRRHGGTMEILSQPGAGTTFSIRLHAAEENRPNAEKTPPPSHAAGKRILVVEDNAMVLRVLVEYLSGDNHSVVTASDGREGLDAFRKGIFDLVITDRAMPVMNGDRLAAAVKRIAPRKPVILLTGFGDMMAASGEMPAGVSLVLSKPITLPHLREAITKVLKPGPAATRPSDRIRHTET